MEQRLNDRILEAIGRRSDGVTSAEIMMATGAPARSINPALSFLAKAGRVKWTGEKRSTGDSRPLKVWVAGDGVPVKPATRKSPREGKTKSRRRAAKSFLTIGQRLSGARRTLAVLEKCLDTLIAWTIEDYGDELGTSELITGAFAHEPLVQELAAETGRDAAWYLALHAGRK